MIEKWFVPDTSFYGHFIYLSRMLIKPSHKSTSEKQQFEWKLNLEKDEYEYWTEGVKSSPRSNENSNGGQTSWMVNESAHLKKH